MNVQLLQDVGLTKPQAMAYTALVRTGVSNAPAIGAEIGESRSNAYKVLDKLCEFGLATRDQTGARVRYFPTSPAALEQLIQKQSAEVALRERKLKAGMPELMHFFLKYSEQPSIRFFQGQEGLYQIYKDQVKTNKPIVYIRSREDFKFFGFETMHKLRNDLADHGIRRRAIIQDELPRVHIPEAERVPIAVSDEAMLLTRTWIDPEDYDEPVEWAAYGDKLSIISYGQEIVGMIIESPQIAKSFRRLFGLLEEGIRRRPGYAHRPLRLTYTGMPEKLKRLASKKR
jgi:sugar-specific transcriptional regulator TrmB